MAYAPKRVVYTNWNMALSSTILPFTGVVVLRRLRMAWWMCAVQKKSGVIHDICPMERRCVVLPVIMMARNGDITQDRKIISSAKGAMIRSRMILTHLS